MPPTVAVLGAGAVGGYVAARLAMLGADRVKLLLVARGAHLQAMLSSGLRIKSRKGDAHVQVGDGFAATSLSAPDEQYEAVDWLLITVKRFDTDAALRSAVASGLIAPHTTIVTLQNGVDAAQQAGEMLLELGLGEGTGYTTVVPGATYMPVTVVAPGTIRHSGTVDRCVAATPAQPLLDLLVAAGVDASTPPDGGSMASILWSKLAAKTACDAISVLGRNELGAVLRVPETRELFERAACEVYDVARAVGVALTPPSTEAALAELMKFVSERQDPHTRSSMLDDLESGKTLEVDALSGVVSRHGRAHGVPTPVHDMVRAVLLPHTKRYCTTDNAEAPPSSPPPPPPPAGEAGRTALHSAACGGLWSHLQPAPADPIMGLVQAFRADPAPTKINLSQGAYRTEEGKPYVLPSVREAERAIAADESLSKCYPPIEGEPQFRALSAEYVFGKDCPALSAARVATVQTLSGTGSLRLAVEWIKLFGPQRRKGAQTVVWLPQPTWPTHHRICQAAGVHVAGYPYLADPGCTGAMGPAGTELDFGAMLAALGGDPTDDIGANGTAGTTGANACDNKSEMTNLPPRGAAVLLHVCAHNPSGVDLATAQWDILADLFVRRGLLPLFDCAYQGYATAEPDKDAYAVRAFVRRGLQPIVCQSYAKSMGLYGERVGALNIVCDTAEEAATVLSVVKRELIRPNYSCPPLHGARIAAAILGTPSLCTRWLAELRGMVDRMRAVRGALVEQLKSEQQEHGGVSWDWGHILRQNGMFALTGLSSQHVEALRSEHNVYMTKDGRLSVAGLRLKDVPAVAQAIIAVLNA